MRNSVAKPAVSRRTPARKRAQIRDYATEHGLTYSAAEEKLLESGLTVEQGLKTVSPRVTALYFGPSAEQNGNNGELFADQYDLEILLDGELGKSVTYVIRQGD